jgi:protease-4
MNLKQIFTNPMTLLGSIRIFGIKFNANFIFKSYSVTGNYYPQRSHATAENPMTSLTPDMKTAIAQRARDYYCYFEAIVATGQSMLVNNVEEVARGHVWTGKQASEVDLIDALGGVDRAVLYAKRAYATMDWV